MTAQLQTKGKEAEDRQPEKTTGRMEVYFGIRNSWLHLQAEGMGLREEK